MDFRRSGRRRGDPRAAFAGSLRFAIIIDQPFVGGVGVDPIGQYIAGFREDDVERLVLFVGLAKFIFLFVGLGRGGVSRQRFQTARDANLILARTLLVTCLIVLGAALVLTQ